MMKGIDIHSSNSIASIFKPKGLLGGVNVQLILFGIAPKQFRLSNNIIPVVNHILIFLNIIFVRGLIIFKYLVSGTSWSAIIILNLLRSLFRLIALWASKVLI